MTKNTDRYSVPNDEDFEPGSNDQVLKNYLGIKNKEKMDLIEAQELERVEIELIDIFHENHQFTLKDIGSIHKKWLGDIYPSAGKYRTVNMKKNDFLFAAANQIETLMCQFENNFLKKFTPCHYMDMKELAKALAIVHVEFIIIHPFREGNGRTARLLADLMAMQANRAPLDYKLIDETVNKKGFEKYIVAIHTGVDRNYEPMSKIFYDLLSQYK